MLILGDSLSSGGIDYDPSCAHRVQDITGVNGWACIVYHQLQAREPGLEIRNLAVGGTDTCSFALNSRCFSLPEAGADASLTPAPGSQWERALTLLRAQPGRVSPITIELGGNDLNTHDNALSNTQQRLDRILRSLRAAAPDADIIVFDVYNPYPYPLPAATQLDGIDEAEAGQVRALFVDLMEPFAGHAQDYVLPHDTHPTPLGQRVIARTIWHAYQAWNTGAVVTAGMRAVGTSAM